MCCRSAPFGSNSGSINKIMCIRILEMFNRCKNFVTFGRYGSNGTIHYRYGTVPILVCPRFIYS